MRESGMNPRLLLVEDDRVSRLFLAEGARALPADVDCAASMREALALASRHVYAAWLIDARLPDGSGAALLEQLRTTCGKPHPPALGHTASRVPADLDALRDAGFDAVVSKPLSVGDWRAAIRHLLDGEGAMHWDDALALRALNGHITSVEALRGLFRTELPKQHRAIIDALEAGRVTDARDELHRLKASCGFVGAARLRGIVDRLHAAPEDRSALQAFDREVAALLEGSPTPPPG